MKAWELILMIVASGGKSNRTVLQKKMYFLAEILSRTKKVDLIDDRVDDDNPLAYRAHYFGPFSSTVARELEELVAIGFLRCDVSVFGRQKSGHEVRRFDYKLTKIGEDYVNDLRAARANLPILELVSNFDKNLAEFSQRTEKEIDYHLISVAAKGHYLLKREGRLESKAFRSNAGKLGWQVDPSDIDTAFELLVATGLAKFEKTSR